MAAQSLQFPRRSLLFMPGDSLKKIQKAATWEVDTVIMDLEDGVAQNRKEAARAVVGEALLTLGFGPRERLVRLNHISTGLPPVEIDATCMGRPDGYIVPKAEDESDLRAVDRLLDAAEKVPNLGTPRHHRELVDRGDHHRRRPVVDLLVDELHRGTELDRFA